MSWDWPSESMEQRKMGGSLGSDSKDSSPKNHHHSLSQLVWTCVHSLLWTQGVAEDTLISEKQD